MNTKQVALYARVSSEQQAEAKTIASQLADIRARITADGFDLTTSLEFIDDGYSGSTVVRPALERLRDVAAAGRIDRLYVHCPDRFARNYARSGCYCWMSSPKEGWKSFFSTDPLGRHPKISYYCKCRESLPNMNEPNSSNGADEANAMLPWKAELRSCAMPPMATATSTSKKAGEKLALRSSLTKPALCNRSIPGWDKTAARSMRCVAPPPGWCSHENWESVLGSQDHLGYAQKSSIQRRSYFWQNALGAKRPAAARATRQTSPAATSVLGQGCPPCEEWITIPVPALIDADLFDAVQEQLEENRRRARISEKGSRYLLQGLLVCAKCGYA
jgi:site-specific DNA recombinase